MVNTTEQLKPVKFENLVENEKYTVLKSGFNKVESKRGDFFSYWFVIKNSKEEVAITSITGNKANKALALFNMKAYGMADCGGFNIKTISKVTTKSGYIDVNFEIEPWRKRTQKNAEIGNLNDFTEITSETSDETPF